MTVEPLNLVSPKTTDVLVILTAKPGTTPQQLMSIMPAEIKETLNLYLEGKIRQWYSKDKGVIFMVDAKTSDEARSVMNRLPLSRTGLMDYEYIPIGPLMQLGFLPQKPPSERPTHGSFTQQVTSKDSSPRTPG